jgi:hypothetical protein
MSEKSEAQEHHIQEMIDRLKKAHGNAMYLEINDSLPLALREKFLENILAMEEAEEHPLFDYLQDKGVSLPAPDDLNDLQLHEKLWEVIRVMAEMNQFLHHTDHLSDRELYGRLWNDILREPAYINPEDDQTIAAIDILGGCSTEDCMNRLKYYADEDERMTYADEYPEDQIPDHVDPPYERDRLLPGHNCFV